MLEVPKAITAKGLVVIKKEGSKKALNKKISEKLSKRLSKKLSGDKNKKQRK